MNECVPDYGYVPVIASGLYIIIGYLFASYARTQGMGTIAQAFSTITWPIWMIASLVILWRKANEARKV